jgi:hypothetical protein
MVSFLVKKIRYVFLHSQYPQVVAVVTVVAATFIIVLLDTAKAECLGGSVSNLLIDLQHPHDLLGMPWSWKRDIDFAAIPIVQSCCFGFSDRS